MKKILGILGLLITIFVVTGCINPVYLQANNIQNIIRWSSLFAIISIGVSFVIITGGIDLSIGSVIALAGCLLPYLLDKNWSAPVAIAAVLSTTLLIGLAHGLLITKLKLQPFIVTLCGLLFYRGFSRWFTDDITMGLEKYESLSLIASGKVPLGPIALPYPFFIMIVIAIAAAILLNKTVYGRYMLALGRNENAARFSGVKTDHMVILSYVICSLLAGLGGILFALDFGSIQPSNFGSFYELYAIAAAVLGGCSLRGGEGSIAGVVIGAAVMRALYNSINILRIPTTLEFAIIGLVILAGTIVDELVKRYAARRRAIQQAKLNSNES